MYLKISKSFRKSQEGWGNSCKAILQFSAAFANTENRKWEKMIAKELGILWMVMHM